MTSGDNVIPISHQISSESNPQQDISWFAIIIKFLIILFPIFNMISVYPLLVITLSSNLRHACEDMMYKSDHNNLDNLDNSSSPGNPSWERYQRQSHLDEGMTQVRSNKPLINLNNF